MLALRGPLRRWLGLPAPQPDTRSGWRSLLAGRRRPECRAIVVSGAAGPLEATNDHALAWLSAGGHAGALIAVWLSGAVVAAAAVAWGHGRFSAALRAGRAGPAAVGLFQPKLVLPTDFAARFTAEERRLIRAHELAHIDRGDLRAAGRRRGG